MKLALLLFMLIALSGCAAHDYYYMPVIQGAGEKEPKGKVAYEVPGSKASISILSLGVKKREKQPMLGIRFTLDQAQSFSLNPADQIVRFGEVELHAQFVRAKHVEKHLIAIQDPHEVVELLYPLPPGREDGSGVPSFVLAIKLQPKSGQAFAKNTRFDRYDAAPQQAGSPFSDDPYYPYDQNPWGFPAWNTAQPYWAPYPYGGFL